MSLYPNTDLEITEYTVDDGQKLPLIRFPVLSDCSMVQHGFTTRLGGVSQGIFSSLNLSFTRGDDPEAVRENYMRVALALDVDPERIVCSAQMHTTNVRVVKPEDYGKGLMKEMDYTDVDGLVTNVPGVTLAAFFADCVPLFFVDPVHKAIGLSHSGWSGTVARMGRETLQAMNREYGTNPEDVLAAVGPSVCRSCYEVSEDVALAFQQEFPGHEAELMDDKGNGKYQLDLWKANEIVLLEAGILPEHLQITDLCTCCHPDFLFSHRASHDKRGNLGAFLTMKED